MEHNLHRHPYTLTSTTLLRLGQVTSSSHATEKRRSLCRRAINYTNLHGGTHVRILTYFFQKTIFQKNFWALSEGPRSSTPTFSNSSPSATYPRIFPTSTPIYALGEAVEPNHRHPYAQTSNVTLHNHLHPIKSPALTTVSTQLISYFIVILPRHSLSKKFFGPFPAAPGAQHHFRIPLLALRTLGFFPASPPQFTPLRSGGAQHPSPLAKIFRHIQG